MTASKSIIDFKVWLANWRNSLHFINPEEIPDDIDWRGWFITNHLRELDILINDPPVVNLLADVSEKYSEAHGASSAQQAIQHFLYDACFVCSSRIFISNIERLSSSAERSSIVKKLIALSQASDSLTKQIDAILPHLGEAVSVPYLEDRFKAGNPSLFAANRKNWSKQKYKNSLSIQDLLICLSKDSLEEAAQIQHGIAQNRQLGGKRASLHMAMDTLTDASIRLSTAEPPKPNFLLVTKIIESLLSIDEGLDMDTVQKRYQSRKARKTRS